MNNFEFFATGFAVISLFWAATLFGLYAFNSIVYMTLAKKANLESPWVAWIPFGTHIIAMKLRNKPWFLPVLLFAGAILFRELIAIMILLILPYVIYKDRGILAAFGMNPNWAFLHLIPGMSFWVYAMIVFLALGNAEYNERTCL